MNLIPLLGFLVTGFIGLTFINRVLDGSMFTTADTAFLHGLRLTKTYDLGPISVTGPNFAFVSNITSMADWEQYVIWGGLGQYVMVFLYVFSFLVLLALGITLLSIGIQIFRAR